MKRSITLLLLFIIGLGLPACSTNPATGKSQLNMLGESQEIEIGKEAAPKFLKGNGGPVPSPQIRAYVTKLGNRLASLSERPKLPWEFHVLDSKVINAFALPGGKVFISRGLLSKMTNEAQLAGVLGHEVGHVTGQHIGQQMTKQMIVKVGLSVVSEVSDAQWIQVMGGTSGNLYLLSYGRSQETQADALGVRYMTKAGYNPVGQIQVMEILKAAAGGSRSGEFFATHPHPQTRIETLERLIPEKYPGYDSDFDRYKFMEHEFKVNILAPLAKLPAPKHGAPKKKAALNSKQYPKWYAAAQTHNLCYCYGQSHP